MVWNQNLYIQYSQVIRSSLLLDKMCQNKLQHPAEVCANLTHYPDVQDEVQRHVTDYEAVYRSVSVVPK